MSFDVKAARAWVAGPAMGTHKACKYILAACDRIKAMETELNKRDTLFHAIAHGDDEHRRWLYKAILTHFYGPDEALAKLDGREGEG